MLTVILIVVAVFVVVGMFRSGQSGTGGSTPRRRPGTYSERGDGSSLPPAGSGPGFIGGLMLGQWMADHHGDGHHHDGGAGLGGSGDSDWGSGGDYGGGFEDGGGGGFDGGGGFGGGDSGGGGGGA